MSGVLGTNLHLRESVAKVEVGVLTDRLKRETLYTKISEDTNARSETNTNPNGESLL